MMINNDNKYEEGNKMGDKMDLDEEDLIIEAAATAAIATVLSAME